MLVTRKVTVLNQGIPHVKWTATDKSTGQEVASFRTRVEARDYVRSSKPVDAVVESVS